MKTKTKIWLVIASFIVIVGCIIFGGVMTIYKWDFTKLSTVKYESSNYKINDDYKSISIKTDTADVVIVPSEEAQSTVICYEQINEKHSVAVYDGTLTIEVVDTRKWYEHISIMFDSPKITISVPQDEYNMLFINSSTGDIQIDNVFTKNVDISTSTSMITASNIHCEDDININVSTGKTNLSNVKCKNLNSSGNTGKITLSNVIAEEKITINRNTGDIMFFNSDASEIFVKTDTGDIEGSLLTNKIFITKTDTGRINVPNTTNGGKCEITTDTGDINIDVNNI